MAGSTDQGLIPLFTAQYSTNLDLLLQQKGSKLRGYCDSGYHVGKMASPINQIAPIQAKSPAGRFAPKQRTDSQFVRRWVFPIEKEIDQLIDSFDELQTIVDPKSGYTVNAAYAIGRSWDDEILNAFTRTAFTGVDAGGLVSESFDTTKFLVAVNFNAGANTGLTVDKLIETKRILRRYHNDLDMEMLSIAIGSQQEADLLRQVQVVSTEFNDRPVLVDGRIKQFLGFNIHVMERVPESTVGSVRGCIAWVKTGLYLGIWKDMTNRVSIANWLSSEPWDLYTMAMFGATRTQPGKIIRVDCADTTGADITP
jgi:Phage capsid protein